MTRHIVLPRRKAARKLAARKRAVTTAAVAGGVGLGLGLVTYGAVAGKTWARYGRPRLGRAGTAVDRVVTQLIPEPEVVERHEVTVAAPADVAFAALRALDIDRSPLVRAIFAVRALPARARGKLVPRENRGLLAETLALGWKVLADVPDRAIIVGGVTRPWEAAPVFLGFPPDEFIAFAEPGYAKIIWTMEVEPLDPESCRVRTETLVCTTDSTARRRFRRYWSLVYPGIRLIRRGMLRLVKTDAERRFRRPAAMVEPQLVGANTAGPA